MDWTAIGTLAGVVFALLSAMGSFIFYLGRHSERLNTHSTRLDEYRTTTGKIFDELRTMSQQLATLPCGARDERYKGLDSRVKKIEETLEAIRKAEHADHDT
jgi:hypothetical protein